MTMILACTGDMLQVILDCLVSQWSFTDCYGTIGHLMAICWLLWYHRLPYKSHGILKFDCPKKDNGVTSQYSVLLIGLGIDPLLSCWWSICIDSVQSSCVTSQNVFVWKQNSHETKGVLFCTLHGVDNEVLAIWVGYLKTWGQICPSVQCKKYRKKRKKKRW